MAPDPDAEDDTDTEPPLGIMGGGKLDPEGIWMVRQTVVDVVVGTVWVGGVVFRE